jgi:CheY-like chemotaxis protein
MVKNNIEQTTVLVVDDQPENIEVISNPLRPFFRVRAVRSGEHALRAVVMDPIPDLILLDVMMPEMNGFEVLARLRENPQTCQIPVIFITARDADEDEQRGLDMGAVDYITKPIVIFGTLIAEPRPMCPQTIILGKKHEVQRLSRLIPLYLNPVSQSGLPARNHAGNRTVAVWREPQANCGD